MKEGKDRAPDPWSYPYPTCLKLRACMGLTKFDAGRLHQMRSGKSYICAHPSWDNDNPTTCRSCNKAPGTFEHAVLSCPPREPARVRHLQVVSDLGPEALVWSSAALLGTLSRYIRSTKTALPPGMFSRPSSAAGSVSSRAFNGVSCGYSMSSQES